MTDLMTLLTHPAMIIAGVLLGGAALFGLGSALCDEIATRKREHLEREVLEDFDAAVSDLQTTKRYDPKPGKADEAARQLQSLLAVTEEFGNGVRLSGRHRFRPSSVISYKWSRDLFRHVADAADLNVLIANEDKDRQHTDAPALATIADVYAFMHGVMSAGMLDEASAKTIKQAIEQLRSSPGRERQRATHPEHATTQG